jgi:hypothetical protein
MDLPEELIGGRAGPGGAVGVVVGPAAAARAGASGALVGEVVAGGAVGGVAVARVGAATRGGAGVAVGGADAAGVDRVRGRGVGGTTGAVTSLAGLLLISPDLSDGAGGAAGGRVFGVDPPTGAPTGSAGAFVFAGAFSSTGSSGWTARRRPSLSALRRTRSA